MNRKIIVFTIIIMTISLVGIMGIQIFWINNASSVKDANFKRSVHEAMINVVNRIERIEKRKALEQNQYEGMLNFNRHLPYDSFITKGAVDSLISAELGVYGIDTKFEFAIYKPEKDTFLLDTRPVNKIELISKGFAFKLFSSDIFTTAEYLIIFFPRESQILITQLWGLLLVSIIFIVIIVYSFTYTISTIFRQKRLSEMKIDFINNMTHEFKTPISTISLACEALSDPDVRRTESAFSNYVNVIREENNRLAGMAEKILQSAVIEKGQMKMRKERIDLHEITGDVIKNIRIQVEIKDGLILKNFTAKNPFLTGDKVHLTNLVYNLLDNANKYTPRRPVIKVKTENTGGGILLTIEDNGIGISKSDQKKIFDKLYRVHTGNIQDARGFGLGLSYVKAIVEEHRGKITIESEVNRGSKFRIYLPNTEPT